MKCTCVLVASDEWFFVRGFNFNMLKKVDLTKIPAPPTFINIKWLFPLNNDIIGLFFSVALTVYVRCKQVQEYNSHSSRLLVLNKMSIILGIASALGLSIVGNFQASIPYFWKCFLTLTNATGICFL